MGQHEEGRFYEGWWRWPLMPVAALLGAIVGTVLVGLLQQLSMKLHGGISEKGWMFIYVFPFLYSVLFGYLYTTISWHVAPRGKMIAGTVMVTLLGVLLVFLVASNWTNQGKFEPISMSVNSLGLLISAIVTLVRLREEAGG